MYMIGSATSAAACTRTTNTMYTARLHLSDGLRPLSCCVVTRLQVFVDEVSCIGCGKCVRSCPDAFFLEESKYGRARVIPGALQQRTRTSEAWVMLAAAAAAAVMFGTT
jgi:ferredoxin